MFYLTYQYAEENPVEGTLPISYSTQPHTRQTSLTYLKLPLMQFQSFVKIEAHANIGLK